MLTVQFIRAKWIYRNVIIFITLIKLNDEMPKSQIHTKCAIRVWKQLKFNVFVPSFASHDYLLLLWFENN